ILDPSPRSVGVARVVMGVEVRGVLELVDEIPAREAIVLANLVVDSHDALIEVLVDSSLKSEEARTRQARGQQPVGEGDRHRIHGAQRYLIIRKGTAERVLQRGVAWVTASGEVPILLIDGGPERILRGVHVARARALPADKEERLVLPVIELRNENRAAEVGAKLVALQEIRNRREEIPSIKFAIAHKLKCSAVRLIGPRFGHRVHHRARVIAVLRAEITGLDAKFLQRIRERELLVQLEIEISIGISIEAVVHL